MFSVYVTSLSQGSGPYTCRVHSLVRERLHLRVSSHRHTLFLLKILSSHHKQLQEFFSSLLLKFPKHCEIPPGKSLCARSKIWRLERKQNCWGMSLSNKLDLRLNLNNDCKVVIYNYILCWLYSMTKSVVIAFILFIVFCGILLYWV